MITRKTLACAMLTLSSVAVLPVSAQVGRGGFNSGANNSASAQAGQAVRDAEKARLKITQDINKIKNRIRQQLQSKPEWASVNNDLKKAEQEMKAAEKVAMAKLAKNADYQAALKQREDARKMRDTATGDDLAKADQQYIDAGLRMKQLEKQALADDAAYNDAKTKSDAAKAKKEQLDSQVNDALLADPEYTPLQQQLQQADDQIKQAKQQLAQARQQEEQQRQQQIQSRSRSGAYGGGSR